jgi:hypothetical protein
MLARTVCPCVGLVLAPSRHALTVPPAIQTSFGNFSAPSYPPSAGLIAATTTPRGAK